MTWAGHQKKWLGYPPRGSGGYQREPDAPHKYAGWQDVGNGDYLRLYGRMRVELQTEKVFGNRIESLFVYGKEKCKHSYLGNSLYSRTVGWLKSKHDGASVYFACIF